MSTTPCQIGFSFSRILRLLLILTLLYVNTSHNVQAKSNGKHEYALGGINANDTYYWNDQNGVPPGQWVLNGTAGLDVPGAWTITTGSSEVVVAVLDTGLDQNHPDLLAKNTGTGFNFVQNTTNIQDVHGHGTAMAGIIGAVSNNNLGVAGMSWGVKIMPIKVSNLYREYNEDAIIKGIKHAVDNNADVINMSFTVNAPTVYDLTKWQDAVNYAYSAGVVIVAGAGNGGENLDSWPPLVPGGLEHVITVGATNRFDQRCDQSTCGFVSGYGSRLDVVAPGSLDIYTTDLVGSAGYNTSPSPLGDFVFDAGGTSAATAFVSGLAALILSIDHTLTPDEVKNIITHSAVDQGTTGKDTLYGWGRIDPYFALSIISRVPADANGDGKVDGVDYVVWLNHYNQQVIYGARFGDFNYDGIVDGIDYVKWLNHYGRH